MYDRSPSREHVNFKLSLEFMYPPKEIKAMLIS
jgi:hypothetical protein